ncbi:DUF7837 family putative zinc-binding protein [Halarchaeum acidiphilum]|nr:hypothetical protein [Halarchaeum acidiphilum]
MTDRPTDADGADGTLGRCPECGTEVPRNAMLIEYEDDDGSAAYAACPGCESVVKPE